MTAVKRINLLPRQEAKKTPLSFEGTMSRDRLLFMIALPMALIFGFDYLRMSNELAKKMELVSRTRTETDNLNRQLKLLNLAPDSGKKNTATTSFRVNDVLEKKSVWTNPLRELSAVIPDGVWLSKLSGGYDRTGSRVLIVNGSAGSEKMVSDFYTRLENSFHMRNVDMSLAERQKDTVPLLYNFEFKVRLSKGQAKDAAKDDKKRAAKAGKK